MALVSVCHCCIHLTPTLAGRNFTTHFSSYPGVLSSTDDYFQTSNGLLVRLWGAAHQPIFVHERFAEAAIESSSAMLACCGVL